MRDDPQVENHCVRGKEQIGMKVCHSERSQYFHFVNNTKQHFLENIREKNAGEYTCAARNMYNTAYKTTNVTVHGEYLTLSTE